MEKIVGKYLSGERALYNKHNLEVEDTTFDDGESPLKECSNIVVKNSIFKWKYPLWYGKDIIVTDSSLLDTARSGIWYTDNITIKDSIIEAPKTFRRSKNITLVNTNLPNAEETLWNCENIKIENVSASGNYFGLNAKNVLINNFHLNGNYAFDGGENIEIHNAMMLSKDSFWNCRNVTVYDSTIIGEYLGWNSENITFINCTVDSLQGMCYMKNVRMLNCKLLNTNLAFEYSTVDAEINSHIDSVKNPISGRIYAKSIGEVIIDEDLVNKYDTMIKVEE